MKKIRSDFKPEVGKRFSRLVVLECERQFSGGHHRKYYLCRCDCGNLKRVRSDGLVSGAVVSCGCYHTEVRRVVGKRVGGMNKTHQMVGTPTHKTWASMLCRCRAKKGYKYKIYGSRGITVCDRWKDFKNFLADMGERPPGKTLDRINNDGNYEPSNCRWATNKEQQANRVSRHGRVPFLFLADIFRVAA